MRKQDYSRLIELCSVERPTAPYTVCNIVPPANFKVAEISYNQYSSLDEKLLSQIKIEWDKQVEQAKKEGRKMFSRPIMMYKRHIIQYDDNRKTTIKLVLGETSFSEHTLAHKIDHSRPAWAFGPNSFVLLEDDEKKRYILFGDRAKTVAHTDQAIEREFFPKGYFYTDNISSLVKGKEVDLEPLGCALDYSFTDDNTILEKFVRSQLSDQTNFTEEMIKQAEIEPLGVFLIPHPHFDASASQVINIKLPCKAQDFGQFHKGAKYTGSSFIRLEELTSFVEAQGDNLMPISRLLLYQYAKRHPEIVE